MKLLVVGAGEMGTWFASSLSDGLEDALDVTFVDLDDERAASAADALGGKSVSRDTDERFDVVCLAVPIPAIETAIDRWAPHAEKALVDVTGVMEAVVSMASRSAPDIERVSFHPLFAAANAPGRIAVVPDSPGPVTDRVRAALSAIGNELFETSAVEHDEAMETVQARVHTAVLAFGLAADDVPDEFQTPVSEAMCSLLDTVTGNDPRVYADIQAVYDGADDVADAARHLADADESEFARLYQEASRTRRDSIEEQAEADGDSEMER